MLTNENLLSFERRDDDYIIGGCEKKEDPFGWNTPPDQFAQNLPSNHSLGSKSSEGSEGIEKEEEEERDEKAVPPESQKAPSAENPTERLMNPNSDVQWPLSEGGDVLHF